MHAATIKLSLVSRHRSCSRAASLRATVQATRTEAAEPLPLSAARLEQNKQLASQLRNELILAPLTRCALPALAVLWRGSAAIELASTCRAGHALHAYLHAWCHCKQL